MKNTLRSDVCPGCQRAYIFIRCICVAKLAIIHKDITAVLARESTVKQEAKNGTSPGSMGIYIQRVLKQR